MGKRSEDTLKGVHKKAGRAILPPNIVFKDKKKYTRKLKYKGKQINDAYLFLFPIKLHVDTFDLNKYSSIRR